MTQDAIPPVNEEHTGDMQEIISEDDTPDISDSSTPTSGDDDTHTRIAQLEKQLAEMTTIAKRAQSDYFTLKMDFDGYVARNDSQKEQMKEDNLINLVKRLIPVFTTLKQMVQTVPAELADNNRVQGVTLTYGKLLSELDSLAIKTISPTIGSDPDLHLHLPLGSEDTDKEMQGKITKVLEDGYLYAGKGREVVIVPAKVVVGK